MPLVKTPALLLHKLPYSETSLILKAYTRENGLTGLIAKGARRPKSRFGGLLDYFSVVELIYRNRPNAELFVLQEVSLLKSFRSTLQNLLKQSVSNILLEIYLRRLYGPEASIPLYELLHGHLEDIDAHSQELVRFPLILCDFLLQFNAVMGVRPQFRRCSQCEAVLNAPSLAFELDMGGPVCPGCRPRCRHATRLYPLSLYKWLSRVSETGLLAGSLTLGEMQDAEMLLLDYSSHHSSRISTVKSYEFYRGLIRDTLSRGPVL